MLLVVQADVRTRRGSTAVKRSIHAASSRSACSTTTCAPSSARRARSCAHNLTYLRLSLVPMLWMIVPLVLVIAQLQFHYGYDGHRSRTARAGEGAAPGRQRSAAQPAAVDGDGGPWRSLEAPAGFESRRRPSGFPAAQRGRSGGSRRRPPATTSCGCTSGDETSQQDAVSVRHAWRDDRRCGSKQGFVNQLLYPSEAPLPVRRRRSRRSASAIRSAISTCSAGSCTG